MSILCINGLLGSGKNELASIIKNEFPQYRFQIHAFADKLKHITSEITGSPLDDFYTQEGKNIYLEDFNATNGEMLQKVGTALKVVDENIWVKHLMKKYDSDKNWIICDLRYYNELEACREKGGILVNIQGDPRGTRAKSKRDLNHSSETELSTFTEWDYVIDNNGSLDDLRNSAIDMIADIMKNKKLSLEYQLPL